MLSGIGDAAELQRHGIEVQQHLPGVGANYHDHLAVSVLMETRQHGLLRHLVPHDAPRRCGTAAVRAVPRRTAVEQRVRVHRVRAHQRGRGPSGPADRVPAGAPQHATPFRCRWATGSRSAAWACIRRAAAASTWRARIRSRRRASRPNLLGDPADMGPLLHGLQAGAAHRWPASRSRATRRAKCSRARPCTDEAGARGLHAPRRRPRCIIPCGSCRMGVDERCGRGSAAARARRRRPARGGCIGVSAASSAAIPTRRGDGGGEGGRPDPRPRARRPPLDASLDVAELGAWLSTHQALADRRRGSRAHRRGRMPWKTTSGCCCPMPRRSTCSSSVAACRIRDAGRQDDHLVPVLRAALAGHAT